MWDCYFENVRGSLSWRFYTSDRKVRDQRITSPVSDQNQATWKNETARKKWMETVETVEFKVPPFQL